ncbi:MAG: uroporphyrinogen-III synthase [Ktedonobacteraceae bacterium]|nr:uroporphyrinogen-III synthase [Ktedonobacteraceae bacterium]
MSEYTVKESSGTLPLKGKRVLVTRTREQAGVLSERLRALGATAVEFPTIRLVPPVDWRPLDEALKRLAISGSTVPQAHYTWLVFTSANGVTFCLERLHSLGYQALAPVRIAAIGSATAAALVRYGLTVDLVPDEYIAEGVAAALIEETKRRGQPLEGTRVLVARAAEARKVLITDLQRAGMQVDEVAAYRTLPAASDDERGRAVWQLLQTRQLDILTFTSSSTVRHFVQWLERCIAPTTNQPVHSLLRDVRIACIGPITSQTARELGLDVHIEAREFTIDGLVAAIIQYYEGE